LKTISDRLNETSLKQKNKKIVLEASRKEINLLITRLNRMVMNLRSVPCWHKAREKRLWRNGKASGHEIKKPIDPLMRLTVQSFQRKI
jgi:hypothetical protein